MTVKCIAVDDEPPALMQMKNYITRVPFLNLVGTFDNALDTIQFLNSHKIDVIFLDIEMEGLTGIQLLNVLKHRPKIIFTTAYDQYAIKAFDLDVTDYLLKPISFERFLQSVEKITAPQIPSNSDDKPKNENSERNYIFVKTEYRMQRVDFKDILYIEGLKEYLLIYTPQGKIITLQSFIKMEEMLSSDNFVRVHKSYIVALDKIENIEHNRIKIKEKLIPIGESYSKTFYSILSSRKLL